MEKIEKRGQMTSKDYETYTPNELDVIAAAANAAIENAEENCFNSRIYSKKQVLHTELW
jgi:hypothetical protein